jgi:hypothetical protein
MATITCDSKNQFEEMFNRFWSAGMRKMNKKGAKKAFMGIIKSQEPDSQWDFTDFLYEDIQKRVKNKQNGFDRLHPTSYLNSERWDDEHIVEDERASTNDILTDTSWARPGNDFSQQVVREFNGYQDRVENVGNGRPQNVGIGVQAQPFGGLKRVSD